LQATGHGVHIRSGGPKLGVSQLQDRNLRNHVAEHGRIADREVRRWKVHVAADHGQAKSGFQEQSDHVKAAEDRHEAKLEGTVVIGIGERPRHAGGGRILRREDGLREVRLAFLVSNGINDLIDRGYGRNDPRDVLSGCSRRCRTAW